MKNFLLTLLVGGLFLPGVSWAAEIGTWQQNCQTGTGFATTSVSPGKFVCWDPVANTNDSPILFVGACENFDLFTYVDRDGSSTDSTVVWELNSCPAPGTGTANSSSVELDSEAKRDAACLAMPDATISAATDAVYGGAAIWIRVEGPDAGTIGGARVIVHCAQGP